MISETSTSEPQLESRRVRVEEVVRDPQRLEVLETTGLLDSPVDESFDRFTRLVASLLDVPVALVSLVDADRQFFKSCFGLREPVASERETPLSHSFCQYVVADRKPLVVSDARLHPELKDNLAIRDLDVIAYLGMPLTTSQGQPLGSLCAIDGAPREWSPQDIALMEDLAASLITEIELRILARELQTSHLHLRHREVQREELMQLLTHDLRNPLSSILGGIELAKLDRDLHDSTREHLEMAREGADFMLNLINSMLDLSRAEDIGLGLEPTWCSPAALLEEARRRVASLAEISGVTLLAEITGLEMPDIQVDRQHIQRMLVNLASNAVQHTPRGGRVELRAQALGDDLVRFEVEDSGRGIPEDVFGVIFEKFGQIEARKVRAGTTGLGLPLCRVVVEAHDGEISVESELGVGTLFKVDLPRTRSSSAGPGRPSS